MPREGLALPETGDLPVRQETLEQTGLPVTPECLEELVVPVEKAILVTQAHLVLMEKLGLGDLMEKRVNPEWMALLQVVLPLAHL